ncbi:hypothetical protein C8Q70DRAFT_708350 [Cubamyces menziesii]|nr:hypothetical protein C8Q70DRAFT_708350 [Cubamyces menziesii]
MHSSCPPGKAALAPSSRLLFRRASRPDPGVNGSLPQYALPNRHPLEACYSACDNPYAATAQQRPIVMSSTACYTLYLCGTAFPATDVNLLLCTTPLSIHMSLLLRHVSRSSRIGLRRTAHENSRASSYTIQTRLSAPPRQLSFLGLGKVDGSRVLAPAGLRCVRWPPPPRLRVDAAAESPLDDPAVDACRRVLIPHITKVSRWHRYSLRRRSRTSLGAGHGTNSCASCSPVRHPAPLLPRRKRSIRLRGGAHDAPWWPSLVSTDCAACVLSTGHRCRRGLREIRSSSGKSGTADTLTRVAALARRPRPVSSHASSRIALSVHRRSRLSTFELAATTSARAQARMPLPGRASQAIPFLGTRSRLRSQENCRTQGSGWHLPPIVIFPRVFLTSDPWSPSHIRKASAGIRGSLVHRGTRRTARAKCALCAMRSPPYALHGSCSRRARVPSPAVAVWQTHPRYGRLWECELTPSPNSV